MPGGKLKEVRNRIQTVISTQQITKAMKLVSASKLRKAQDKILSMRPYSEKLQEIMPLVVDNLTGEISTPYAEKREVQAVLLIVINSNRGLCGAFNSSVIKRTKYLIDKKYKSSKITVLTIGKKADDYFKKTDWYIKGTTLPRNLFTLYNNLTFELVALVAEQVMDSFTNKQFDEIVLVYNQFKNAAVQILHVEPFLPIPKMAAGEEKASSTKHDFIYEPSAEHMMHELIPKILKTQLFKALLDSNAAEHGARMTAMDKATENASEILRELRIKYNRERQAEITTELAEIVGGANALEEGV